VLTESSSLMTTRSSLTSALISVATLPVTAMREIASSNVVNSAAYVVQGPIAWLTLVSLAIAAFHVL